MSTSVILAINAGSSSLKLTTFSADSLARRTSVTVDRVGTEHAQLTVVSPDGRSSERVTADHFDAAFEIGFEAAERSWTPQIGLHAVGHRIVHGGSHHAEPARVTPALVEDLRRLAPLDPTHMPHAIALIEAVSARHPRVPQVVCFDTTFHRTMPRVAQLYPVPRSAWGEGVRRYGFHGLSCEYIVGALRALDSIASQQRLLVAHLGNGASVTAVHHGASVDTTMGFSPTGGLMMGTRSGDLDPGVLTYLMRERHYSAEQLDRFVTEHAGLLAVSGFSSDMHEVLDRGGSTEAAEAVDLYCYIARKHIGALAAALNGVDTLVFTGGIGEHAATIRASICEGLEYLGLRLSPDANTANRPVISAPGSRVTVRVIGTDEDYVIARHVQQLLQ